jgi:microcystin-dependent protein
MEEFIGVIQMFAGYRCPNNFMFCEGQTLSINDHQALYSIIGSVYGGDGIHNFKLPDLRPKNNTIPDWGNNPRYLICINGLYPDFF